MTYHTASYSPAAELDAYDALHGVVAAYGGISEIVATGGREYLAIRFDQPRWIGLEGLRVYDAVVLEFRRAVYPAITAAGFSLTGVTYSKDLRADLSVFHMNATKGPLTAAEEHCITTFTGRD
jgi:hypothetical protein